jgi:hypothetical protein
LVFIPLLPANLDEHSSAAWAVELAEKYPLPRAQRQSAVLYQHLPAAADDGAFAMGIGIAFAVPILRLMLRYKLRKRQKYIVHNGWVGVFVYGNARRRMRTVDYRITFSYTSLTDNALDFICYVDCLIALFAAYAEIFCNDFHCCPLHLFDDFDAQQFA